MFANSLKELHERSLERAKALVMPGSNDLLSKLSLQHSKSTSLVERRSSSTSTTNGAEMFKLLPPSLSSTTTTTTKSVPVDVTKVKTNTSNCCFFIILRCCCCSKFFHLCQKPRKSKSDLCHKQSNNRSNQFDLRLCRHHHHLPILPRQE